MNQQKRRIYVLYIGERRHLPQLFGIIHYIAAKLNLDKPWPNITAPIKGNPIRDGTLRYCCKKSVRMSYQPVSHKSTITPAGHCYPVCIQEMKLPERCVQTVLDICSVILSVVMAHCIRELLTITHTSARIEKDDRIPFGCKPLHLMKHGISVI